MATSVDRIHHQYHKGNVVDIDFDVVQESKEFQKLSLTDVPQLPKKESNEFQKLSLTDNMPPQPQVPKSGKPLEQKKPAVDFLYHDITKRFATDNYSPSLVYYNSLPKPEWMHHEKPSSASTYSPSNPPDWTREWDCKAPKNAEEYVLMKRAMLASVMSKIK